VNVGILGGGQLGYMLALAGYPLGLQFRFLDPSPEAPVGRIALRVNADFNNGEALERFANGLDIVTYEFENVPVAAVKALAQRVAVYPPPKALEVAQDRLREKNLFRKLGIATPDFLPVASAEALDAAVQKLGLPAVLKTCRLGYDGKGQWLLRQGADVTRAKSEMAAHLPPSPQGSERHTSSGSHAASKHKPGSPETDTEAPEAPFVLERFVAFSRELSILAVRSRSGEIIFYPLVENHHREGILRLSLAPAPHLENATRLAAEDAARRVLEALDYVGVLAIELFECEGKLLANEMAPRVHNSGHWTIEGAVTSQFENHLRAVCDYPLGSTLTTGHSAMVNLIGEVPDLAVVLCLPDAHLHLYGKTPRPGRKLGHVTLRASSSKHLAERLATLPEFFRRPIFCLDTAQAVAGSVGASGV
jgi:5-(carboxyamino)imidazole ribonucleotide synthase